MRENSAVLRMALCGLLTVSSLNLVACGGSDSGIEPPPSDAATPLPDGSSADVPTTERFSFFVTSLVAMRELSGSAEGFGGDLRFGKADGLSGADEICRQVAERSMANNGKTWRAFLSVTQGPNGTPVHAIDRIGEGPWYDRVGRLFALSKEDLLQQRPRGADPAIINDFPNEYGTP
ncbi:MAG: hypothetical protein ABW133_04750, partial [Polyangiaceae bacterium]